MIYEKRFVGLLIVLVFAVILFVATCNNADASVTNGEKLYTTVEIKKGDTLYDIAKMYCNDESMIEDYVDDISEINSLINPDYIVEGRSLTIYYYK